MSIRQVYLCTCTYMYMRLYICIHTHIQCICIYTDIYIHILIHIHMHVHTHTHTVYIYMYMCIYMYIHMYIYSYIHAYIHLHVHMYIHTYIYTYIYTHIYIYTYIYTHIYIYIYVFMYAWIGMPVCTIFNPRSLKPYGSSTHDVLRYCKCALGLVLILSCNQAPWGLTSTWRRCGARSSRPLGMERRATTLDDRLYSRKPIKATCKPIYILEAHLESRSSSFQGHSL